jgi:hypothetical protein
MRRVTRCTCSHCQRETYFEASIGLTAISGSKCRNCGHTGMVITLDVEPPKDAIVLDRVPQYMWVSHESTSAPG